MTPTPEIEAMAERIADRGWRVKGSPWWTTAYDAALAAIIETTEAAINKLDECRDPCPQCHDAIRNGEHLK